MVLLLQKKLVKNGVIEEIQLEGHLGITKEIVAQLSPEQKHLIGLAPADQGQGLLHILVDEYIFSASKAMLLQQRSGGEWQCHSSLNEALLSARQLLCNSLVVPYGARSIERFLIWLNSHIVLVIETRRTFNHTQSVCHSQLDRTLLHVEDINPICSSPATLQAAFDAVVALATGCVENLKFVTDAIREMFYDQDTIEINEWEYLPPVGPRPSRGFVGLKNAGATCYMNSVLQQVR